MQDLNQEVTLVLNSSWSPIASIDIEKAMNSLFRGAFRALDIQYQEDGEIQSLNPVEAHEWLELPIRDGDLFLRTVNRTVKIPTVLIAKSFSKTFFLHKSLTIKNIRERDGGICQYSGRRLSHKEGSVDHIIPRSRGGENSWGNLVYCHKDINRRKGNKLNHEIGLSLLKEPFEPRPLPLGSTLQPKHRDWHLFLKK